MPSSPLVSTYNAAKLNAEFLSTMQAMYPSFSSLACVVTGQPGVGKSTLLASVPVADGKKRLALDLEDSMAYLDAGPEGQDIYTPIRHCFAMRRIKFPGVPQILSVYRAIAHPEDNKDQKYQYGALIIDNIALMQDAIVMWIKGNAQNPQVVRQMWAKFDMAEKLPKADTILQRYAQVPDASIWDAVKAIPAALLLACKRQGINFIGSTEMANVWENYNQSGAKIKGQKAKVWDVWLRYTDFVLVLERNVNSHEPPSGSLSPYQPKMRMQGMMPKFVMDWSHFIEEVKASQTRTTPEIPEENMVRLETLTEGSEETAVPEPGSSYQPAESKEPQPL